jgi:hypothetical protein
VRKREIVVLLDEDIVCANTLIARVNLAMRWVRTLIE